MKSKNSKEMQEMMLTKPVGPLITKLAIPTMISMLVTSLYSLADTFFVAQLGVVQSSAVGIVFSIMTIIQATGLLFGQGCANTISPLLGRGETDKANQVFSTAFFTALVLLTAFGLVCLVFIEPIVKFLGATEETLRACIAYGSVIVIGAPWLGVCYTMNNIFRAEGKAVLGMCGMASGALFNVGFDALFIFGFEWGVAGAALATVLSQLISFIILLSFFILKKSNLRLSVKSFRFSWWIYKKVFSLGFPSLLRNLGSTVCNIVLMNVTGIYGASATAAFSIVGRVSHAYQSLTIGFGQGMQPVVGYNWGARKTDRVKKAYNFSLLVCTLAFVVLGLLSIFGARYIMMAFLGNPAKIADSLRALEVTESIKIGGNTLLYQGIVMPLMGVIILSGMLLQCSEHGLSASVLALLRQGVVYLPLIMLLNHFLGLTGVELTQAISDVVVFILTLIITKYVRRKDHF